MVEGRSISFEDKDPTGDYSLDTQAMLSRMVLWADDMRDYFPDPQLHCEYGYSITHLSDLMSYFNSN